MKQNIGTRRSCGSASILDRRSSARCRAAGCWRDGSRRHGERRCAPASLGRPRLHAHERRTYRLVRGVWSRPPFAGRASGKGKSDAQKVYRLDAIREGATRFDAKVHRGLTRYVGRERELEKLERSLDAIGTGIQVFDIVGEPGIGKSRLVHEFLRQIVKERARVLTANCTPDGQQTPFRAFIEIVAEPFGSRQATGSRRGAQVGRGFARASASNSPKISACCSICLV